MKNYSPQKRLELISVGFVCIAVLLYAHAIWRFSLNIPLLDDYDAVLGFLNNFVSASSFNERGAILFGQHNEHRLVFNHVIQLLSVSLFGEINFKYLIYLGNISWFGVIYILWKYSASKGLTFYEFSPIAILLLSFCSTEAMTFATPAIQFHFQILFTLVAILLMTKGLLIPAMTFVFLAVFTSGGGLLTIPIVGLYYLLGTQWRNLLISSLISLLIIFCYFQLIPYSSPNEHPNIFGALRHPETLLLFFLGLLGSFGMINKLGIASAVTFGVGSIFIFVRNLVLFYKISPFLFWFGGYILMTVLATSFARSSFGLEYSLASRYSFFGILLLAVNYLAYMQILKSDNSRKRLVIFALAFSVIAFTYWYGRGTRALEQIYTEINQENFVRYPNQDHAFEIIKNSKRLGLYQATWLDGK